MQMNHLMLIGGSTVKDAVRRIMTSVMEHKVTLGYNWAGKAGWKGKDGVAKRPFGNLVLCTVITSISELRFLKIF